MKREEIRMSDFRFSQEIIIPEPPAGDLSEVARAMADEIEHTLADRIMGSTFEQRGVLWVPVSDSDSEPTTFTKDEVVWRHDSRTPAATTSTSGAPSFEEVSQMMADLERKMRETDPLYDYRGACELVVSRWLTDETEVVVIDREASGLDSAILREDLLQRMAWETPKRWMIVAAEVREPDGKVTNAVEITRRQMQARGLSMSIEDVLAAIAYGAHQQATTQRFERRQGFTGFADGIAFREW